MHWNGRAVVQALAPQRPYQENALAHENERDDHEREGETQALDCYRSPPAWRMERIRVVQRLSHYRMSRSRIIDPKRAARYRFE